LWPTYLMDSGIAFGLLFLERLDWERKDHMDDKNSTKHAVQDVGVANQIGKYSDAVEVSSNLRWLFTSGTPGLSVGGYLPPDIIGQSEIVWGHILKMLQNADMVITDVVKVTQYLTRSEDIAAYATVRTRFVGDARPASMLLVIPQLVRPEFLIEVEVIAAKSP
jgi:2-iminobutanoate/2-iminopropanoate deaminase